MAYKEDPEILRVLTMHKQQITGLSFNPNNQQFASCSLDNKIMTWNEWADVDKAVRCYKFAGHEDAVTSVEFSPDCKLLASSSKDQTVRLWQPTIRGASTQIKAHQSTVNTVNFSFDGFKLITAANDKSVKLWDVHQGKMITSYTAHNNWVKCAKFTSLGNLIVSCSDRRIHVWDLISNQEVHLIEGFQGKPNWIAVHPNNEVIAVAMDSGTVRVYDIINKKLRQHYTLHDASVTCVDWHPKKNFLISSGLDSSLKIVDVIEGRPLYTLSQANPIHFCKFNFDGEYFASGASNGVLSLWQTNFINL